MNKSLLATLIAGALLSTVPLSAPVEATSAIQRCESPDGSLVYTDKACAIFGAKAVPMSGELLARIEHEESAHEEFVPQSGEMGQYADAATPLDASDTSTQVSQRSPSSGCARSATQLAMDLRGALVLGDVNRVAESYYWVGMSNQQGQRMLDRLQHLLGKTVVDSHYYNAQIAASPMAGDSDGTWMATTNMTATGGNAGMLQLTLGNDAQSTVVDFDVQRYAGCYFVRF
ncbi:MAG TPA: hypothetical protein VHF02_07380 [Luteimonas sp.]|nr:hypothetical protein [Luteimonas sp.]